MRIKQFERDPDNRPDNTIRQFWELYDGSMRLFICGPGVRSWWPVTAPSSAPQARHGTAAERNIARKALLYLSRRFHDSCEATPEDIRAALEKYGWTADELTRYPSSQA
jgi:hypothetical protein